MTTPLIARPDLVARVATPDLPSIRLIIAAAGYGKTALMTQLREAEPDATFLDEATPETLAKASDDRLVFAASRSAAGLGVAAGVASGAVAIFGETDLAFGTQEVQALAAMLCTPLDAASIADVTHRTEGWPIAASLALRRQDADDLWLTATPLLSDYIDEVVLADASLELRRDLRLAAVPEVVTADLYEATGGGTPFSALLARRPLLRPVTGRDDAFRFHPLMRRHLNAGWEGTERRERAAAARRVAVRLGEAERYVEAAPLAIEAGDEALAGEVVHAGARRFVADGRIAEAIRWMDAVGHDGIGPSGDADIFGRTARMLGTQSATELGELVLEAREAVVEARATGRPDLRLRYQLLLARLFGGADAALIGDVEALVRDASRADDVVWSESLAILSLARAAVGDLVRAEEASRRAESTLLRNRSWYALSYAAAALADAHRVRGGLAEAEAELRRFREACEDPRLPAAAFVALSEAEAMSLSDQTETLWATLAQVRGLLPILQSASATTRLNTIAASSASAERPHAAVWVPYTQPILVAQAARAGLTVPAPENGPAGTGGSDAAIARLMARNDALRLAGPSPNALREAEALAAEARMNCAAEEEAFVYLTKAGLLAVSDPVAALRLIRQTAEEHLIRGVARPFVASRGWLRERLDGEHRVLLDGLIGTATGAQAKRVAPASLTIEDLLTPKEAQVLRIMASGGSNQQVADDLYVSLATAKWHVRNILGKLDAPNRTAAVAKGRALGLVV